MAKFPARKNVPAPACALSTESLNALEPTPFPVPPATFEDVASPGGCRFLDPDAGCSQCQFKPKRDPGLVDALRKFCTGADVHEVNNLLAVYETLYRLQEKGVFENKHCLAVLHAEKRLRQILGEARMRQVVCLHKIFCF